MTKIFLDQNQSLCWRKILDLDNFKLRMGWFIDLVFENNVQFVNSIDNCDIYISECTNLRVVDDKLNIIICGESDNLHKYNFYMNLYRHRKDVKFIGTVEDSDISFNIPIVNIARQYGFKDPYILDIETNHDLIHRYNINRNRLCFMRKNKNSKTREYIGRELSVVYVNGDNKTSILNDFVFNYCPENSLSRYNGKGGYITEKIYDAVISNCIPVYYGGNIKKYSILNSDRVIYVNEKNCHEVNKLIQSLTFKEIQNIFNLPILRYDYETFVMKRKELLRYFILNNN